MSVNGVSNDNATEHETAAGLLWIAHRSGCRKHNRRPLQRGRVGRAGLSCLVLKALRRERRRVNAWVVDSSLKEAKALQRDEGVALEKKEKKLLYGWHHGDKLFGDGDANMCTPNWHSLSRYDGIADHIGTTRSPDLRRCVWHVHLIICDCEWC